MVQVSNGGRMFVKTRYFFKAGELPHNYHQVSCTATPLERQCAPTAAYLGA